MLGPCSRDIGPQTFEKTVLQVWDNSVLQFGVGVSTCDLRTIYPYPKDTSGEVYFFVVLLYITETQEYISLMLKKKIEISLLDFLFLQNILHKFSFSPLFLSLPGTVSASAVYKSSIVQSHFARDFF